MDTRSIATPADARQTPKNEKNKETGCYIDSLNKEDILDPHHGNVIAFSSGHLFMRKSLNDYYKTDDAFLVTHHDGNLSFRPRHPIDKSVLIPSENERLMTQGINVKDLTDARAFRFIAEIRKRYGDRPLSTAMITELLSAQSKAENISNTPKENVTDAPPPILTETSSAPLEKDIKPGPSITSAQDVAAHRRLG